MPNNSFKSRSGLDRFSRTVDFIGPGGFDIINKSFVVVVGQGGVGSHAAVALVRSGVGRVRLIDSDKVQLSNLNRHAVARPDDVGEEKVVVMRRHLLEIWPEAEIEAVSGFVQENNVASYLEGSPDYVIDAIDGLNSKVALLEYCVRHAIRVVSSMGASARSDPGALNIGPIEESKGCPLARHVRKRLRRRGVETGITAVYSTEPRRLPLPPDEDETPGGHGRVRNRLPSLSTLPGIFGYAAATVVIMDISSTGTAGPGNSNA